MTTDEYYKHAYSLYQNAVSAEGSMRQYYLQQAKNVLNNLPDGWPGKRDLMSRINSMLY